MALRFHSTLRIFSILLDVVTMRLVRRPSLVFGRFVVETNRLSVAIASKESRYPYPSFFECNHRSVLM